MPKQPSKPVEAHRLTLNLGDVLLKVGFTDLAPCHFPIPGAPPLPVEIPPEGSRSHFPGLPALESYPSIVRLPAYADEQVLPAAAAEEPAEPAPETARLLDTTPLAAIAIRTDHPLEHQLYRAATVLLAWRNGSSVVVALDWVDGNRPDGQTGAEWHLRATEGLPLAQGLEQLASQSRVRPSGDDVHSFLYFTPAALGASVAGEPQPVPEGDAWRGSFAVTSAAGLHEALRALGSRLTHLATTAAPEDASARSASQPRPR